MPYVRRAQWQDRRGQGAAGAVQSADYERVDQMVRQSLCEEADGFPLDLRQSELPGGGECLV
jgi:hypothetical protein